MTDPTRVLAPRPTRRRRRRAALICAALAAGAILLLLPRPAQAGSYTVRQCTPDIPAQASWESSYRSYRSRRSCASGGGLQIYHRGDRTPQGRRAAWTWNAPAGTIFKAVRANASLTSHAGHRPQLWVVPVSGPAVSFGGDHAAFRSYRRRGELTRFETSLRCTRSSGCGRADADRARAYVKGVTLRLADRTPPRVREASGPLLAHRVVRGAHPVTVSAADRGGGVSRIWVEAGGGEVASRPLSCELGGGYSTRLVPCPRSVEESRTIDTAGGAFATGPNALSACAEDFAQRGRANSGCRRAAVWVDNACPGSSGEGARLGAGFAGGKAAAVVQSNRQATLTGRLLDQAGLPVAGATVCALTRTVLPEAPVEVAATGRSGSDGRYAIDLPPGPSRQVFVHNARSDRVVARHGLKLRSRVRPTLRLRPAGEVRNGRRLRFTGHLPGPACAGRRVEIEARVGPRRWQVFRAPRSNRSCAYAAAYRLRSTPRPTRYLFRARVRRQAGYPYLPGRSLVRSKRVGG